MASLDYFKNSSVSKLLFFFFKLNIHNSFSFSISEIGPFLISLIIAFIFSNKGLNYEFLYNKISSLIIFSSKSSNSNNCVLIAISWSLYYNSPVLFNTLGITGP
jgi:hypothetical protein